MLKTSPTGLPLHSLQGVTAGTTQTQAGATAMSKTVVQVTTGNASDGVALPRADKATCVGQSMIVKNLSAVALKVYPYYTTSATVDDGSAYGGKIAVDGGALGAENVFAAHAASVTRLYVCTAINTWVSVLLS